MAMFSQTFLVFFLALLCVSTIDAAHLRRNASLRKGSKDKEIDLIEETRKATAYSDDITDDDDTTTALDEFFECTVAVTAGSMEIEIPSAKDVLTCDRPSSHPLGEAVFEIIGEDSILDEFFQDVDLTHGDVTLNVSSKIVNHMGEIDINRHTLDQVYITYTGNQRRRELSGNGVDTRNTLVIRVSDDRKRISSRAKVSQTANQLRDDFFAWDNNNLRTIYNRCSNKQLKIKPVTQGQAFDGVIDIDLYDLDPNFKCNNDKNYVQLGNKALEHPAVKALKNVVDHRIVILPNQGCVDFRGAAAWARVNGDLSWMQSQYAAMPIVQVHEFGHMLGFRHSGTKISETQYQTYGDGTGYMSNKAPWNSEGADMCFNAAKTWYSGWYSQYDEDVRTNIGNFSGKTFRMTHIDDVKNEKSNTSSKVVLRLSNSKSNSNYQHLFVNYNRAKGMNSGVMHHKDEVTIVWQAGKSGESVILSDLTVGQTYTNSTWDSNGKLSVHFDRTENNGEIAVVEVKIGGSGYSEPEPGPSNQCVDYKQSNGAQWYDADGSYYNCDWYGSNNVYCSDYGNGGKNFGRTANQACCVCGGGSGGESSNVSNPRPTPSPTRSPTRSPTPRPTPRPTRAPTPAPTPQKNNDKNGNNAKCNDIPNWYDQDGSYYNCNWYGSQASHCSLYGNLKGQFNKNANQACCACGGGQ